MNKNALKTFAIEARRKLIADISYRAGLMGITDKKIADPLPQSTSSVQFFHIGTAQPYQITGPQIAQRAQLVAALRRKEAETDYKTAYEYIIEEVAYTWFNRLIAIRFMEVNDYLPSGIRVLSSESGKREPDIITHFQDAELNMTPAQLAAAAQLQLDNDVDGLFQMLFILQCNALNACLPDLFEPTSDYTELLLNLRVIDPDGVLARLVNDIPEDDFNVEKGGQVEIIGWLYQYYNTEPKDHVFELLKKNVKISKENIPAATQLFTPDWIVRYMVENSLGRLWLEGHPSDSLKAGWKYYLDEAPQEPAVETQLAALRRDRAALRPEDIRLIDPCMGSGHILVYAFDVLMQLYESAGYGQRDAAQSILEHNLYGLDIDERAAQMAYFAVMMKARQYDRRILTRGIRPHVYAMQESNGLPNLALGRLGEQESVARRLLDSFTDAKLYGSILHPAVTLAELDALDARLDEVDKMSSYGSLIDMSESDTLVQSLAPLVAVARNLVRQYDVVCTNPPYMGASGMSPQLSEYVKKHYPDSKSDMSTVFMEKTMAMCRDSGYMAMINIPGWMFLSSFEKLREKLLRNDTIVNMVHPGRGIFGSDFGSVTFVFEKQQVSGYKGCYRRLFDAKGEVKNIEMREVAFLEGKGQFVADQSDFAKIPGSPVAYWVSEKIIAMLTGPQIGKKYQAGSGLSTADNERFLRMYWEVNNTKIAVNKDDDKKWFLFQKGGEFRKWYGNLQYVVNWENDGAEIKYWVTHNPKDPNTTSWSRRIFNTNLYFQKGITWSVISIGDISFRATNEDSMISNAAGGIFGFESEHERNALMGALNTKIWCDIFKIINPTLNYSSGVIQKAPVPDCCGQEISDECISLSRADWDTYETSWDFAADPLVNWSRNLRDATSVGCTMDVFYNGNPPCANSPLELCYLLHKGNCARNFAQLKANEEELNRIFIDIYGLGDELTPTVEDKDVTIYRIFDEKADIPESMGSSKYALTKQDVVKNLLSYAVGCMFGRYSLDKDGLAFAGGNFDAVYWKFKGQAALDDEGNAIDGGYAGISLDDYNYQLLKDSDDWMTATQLSFAPDYDNCIPITDEEYLPDDIVTRLCDWLKAVFGPDELEQNLDFIAAALNKRGNTSREIIRSYFVNDFYKDHCKMYQKRPIYWLYDSGKQNGFKALIYLHRYNQDTTGLVRVDYLHTMQKIYTREIDRMQDAIDHSTSAREASAATKRQEKLVKQLKECRDYDEKLGHLALARIPLDLDDGVKVNYRKLQTAPDGKLYEVLADSKNIMAKK